MQMTPSIAISLLTFNHQLQLSRVLMLFSKKKKGIRAEHNTDLKDF